MRTGYIISGIAHGLLVLWLLFGGLFTRVPDEPLVAVAEVSIISGAEFAAMTEAREAPVATAPEVSTAPPARPEPQPEPDPVPEPPAPEPEPQPEPEPEPLPEPETPPEADRVASEVIEAPEQPLPDGPTLVEDTAPDPTPEPETPVEELPAQAPQETTTEIVTEAETPSNAPTASIRPRARPAPPVQQPTPEQPATASAEAIDTAVDSALADVLGEAAAPAPSGPPLTRGEKDGLRVAVQRCWNVGSLSTDALSTTVVVLVKMARNGRPEAIDLVTSNGASATATRGAFEAARRAVIRCGASGYPLPADKYDHWREIEMTFDPSKMRIR